MRSLLVAAAIISLFALLIGCGGSGSTGGGTSPNSATRLHLQKTLSQSQLALVLAGFQTPGQAGFINGSNGGTSGSTGGGGGYMMIGGYVRGIGSGVGTTGGTGGAEPSTSGSTSSSTNGGGGGFYFDDYLGLWADTQETPGHFTTLLYTDEAKTTAAGSFDTVFSNWDSYPVTYSSTYEITAGTFSGANGKYDVVYQTEDSGHMQYTNHWPGYGDDSGKSSWSPDGSNWTYTSNPDDGSWAHYSGHFAADGSGSTTSENSDGYKWNYHFNADGSGGGTIEGPDPGLPATITWTADGHYHIVYADGSFEDWDFGSGSSGGTVGTTTGSTTDVSTTGANDGGGTTTTSTTGQDGGGSSTTNTTTTGQTNTGTSGTSGSTG
jgi:hypothetical protein